MRRCPTLRPLPFVALLLWCAGCATTYEERLADGTTKSSTYYPWNDPNRRNSKATPELQMAYAKYAESQGNSEKARELYEASLKKDPDAVDAHLGLARLDHLAGNKEHARKRLEEARKRAPRSPDVLSAMAELNVADRKFPEAIAQYQQALEVAPHNQTIRYQFAVALAKSGQREQALGQFTQAVGVAAAHYNLGLILHEQGDLVAAEEQFTTALVKNPKLDQAQGWLDDTRRELERRQDARVATASHLQSRSGYREAAPAISSNPRATAGHPDAAALYNQITYGQAPPATGALPDSVPVRAAVAGSAGYTPAAVPANSLATPSAGALPAAGSIPPPPPGLTPAQREQWANQFIGSSR